MLIGMDRKELIMKKPAKVHKDSNPGMSTIAPASLTLFKKAGDEVAWEIDAVLTTTEFLVVKSSNSTIVPDTSGGGGSSKLGLTPNYPSTPGLFPWPLRRWEGVPEMLTGWCAGFRSGWGH